MKVPSPFWFAVNWLEPQQTLREQGLIDETTVVTLRKKFFFSDQNVNANDPVQLHLLYEQVCVCDLLTF